MRLQPSVDPHFVVYENADLIAFALLARPLQTQPNERALLQESAQCFGDLAVGIH